MEYISQTKLAELLGVTRRTIYYWEKNSMIPPPKRVNNRPVYTENNVKEIANIRGIRINKK